MVEISVTALRWCDQKRSLFLEWWDVVLVASKHKSFTAGYGVYQRGCAWRSESCGGCFFPASKLHLPARVSQSNIDRTDFSCTFKGNTSSSISPIHKSHPVPRETIIVHCVLTLGVVGDELYTFSALNNTNVIKLCETTSIWVLYYDFELQRGGRRAGGEFNWAHVLVRPRALLSGSGASTQTIKVNKRPRWVKAVHRKRVSMSVLLWEMTQVK